MPHTTLAYIARHPADRHHHHDHKQTPKHMPPSRRWPGTGETNDDPLENLRVDVHDPYILVALRGTCFRAKYRRQDAPWLATDEYGPEDLMCIFFPERRQSQPRYDNWPACMRRVRPPLAAASLRPAPIGLVDTAAFPSHANAKMRL
jgi:hypothetical protein